MYIAMNRFHVKKGAEKDFEQVWLSRDIHLTAVPGFIEFHLLKGPEHEDYTPYTSHSVWQSRAKFEAWTRSEAFRLAHRGCRTEQAALPRPSAARRLRGPPDRASRERCGRLERSSRPGTSQPRLP